MGKLKNLLLLLFVAVMVAIPTKAWAADYIDLSRPTSLNIAYDWDGAEFNIYRVADVDKTAKLTPCKQFKAYSQWISWDYAKQWTDLAINLSDYAEGNIEPMESATVSQESCHFAHLKAGLYLVVGHEIEVDGVTYACKPFLICLPEYTSDDSWAYNAVAYPKSGAWQPNTTPPRTPPLYPDDPDRPDNPDNPDDPDKPPKLPQTGQLWWPVPTLVCSGLTFMIIGMIRRRTGEREEKRNPD